MASLRSTTATPLLLTALTLLLSIPAVRADDRVCYLPNGVESGDVPCSSSDKTHCCGPYGICLENGFCINTSGKPYTLSRGSCTDPDWGGSCPTQCTDSPYDGIGATISILNEVAGSWSSYCCGTPEIDGDKLVCPNNLSSFTIEHGDMIYGYAGLINATEISSTSSVSGSANSTCDNPSSASSSVSSDDPGDSSSTGSSNTAVGAGVGVSLGAALAGALAWGFWERRKRLQVQRQVVAGGGMPGMGPAEPKPMYAGCSSTPPVPYPPQPPQPPQSYPPQPYYPVQQAYAPLAAQVPPQTPRELPHHNYDAVEMMDNPRQY